MKESIKHINPLTLKDVAVLQETLVLVLNVLEEQAHQLDRQKQEIKELKDVINRLKKEQGIPVFPPKKDKETGESEEEEESKAIRKRGKGNKGSKKPRIPIDRTEICVLDKSDLPSDAVLKYYDDVIQQDVKLIRENVLYKVAVYYSASLGKTYRGEMPTEYVGEFGLNIRSLTQMFHHYCDMTRSKLMGLYKSLGVLISTGTINNFLLQQTEWAIKEQREILRIGIANSPYTQIDGTMSKERGVRKATQMICGEYFSIFYTMDNKSRLEVLRALLGKPEEGLQVAYNEKSISLLKHFGVSQADQLSLSKLFQAEQVISLANFRAHMEQVAPSIYAKKNMFARITESMALGYYHSQDDFPVVQSLLSDDAPEYKKIAAVQEPLCWVHDNRHYKKLVPKIQIHYDILEQIQQEYWIFYAQLLDYKESTNLEQALLKPILLVEFDRVFSQQTNYFQVNTCLERTLKNKKELLAVLDNPALPLHNNAAELEARRVVRKRDISLHTWSSKGTEVRDAFMSIVQTAARLNVSALEYIKDRVSQQYEMTPLATLVQLAYT